MTSTTTAGSRAGYADLGRQLAADWVITGSYQHAGGRLRITPQLLDVASGEIEALAKIDGTWDEIFELQDRVASGVMDALRLTAATEASERLIPSETRLLEAFEHYSRGRRGLYQMGKGTLEDARQHFESALSLDPDYAMAHSGLGSTLAMRFISKTNPDDLRLARAHLERARELDPELPEPYPWLCYVYIREGRFGEALEAGQRGVQLLPDLVHAQYFMSAAYTASCESHPAYYQRAVNHLREAARIDPRWQATWYVLGAVALFHGNYERAEEFAKRLLLLNSCDSPLRFIGAEMLLGTAELRRGNTAGAIRWFTESLTVHGRSAHVYRDLVCAFSSCGLGDTCLRHGDAEVALTHYRRAWQAVQEAPTMLAQERAGSRALAGMAAAYAAQGELERARELLAQSLQRLANARLPVHVTPLAWLAELLYAIAAAHVRTGQYTEALNMLEQALSAGWRDAHWPERDPEIRPLHQEPRFTRFLEELRRCPAIDLTIPDVATHS
jgi:tetratricopeptide (TPR) repeat protein